MLLCVPHQNGHVKAWHTMCTDSTGIHGDGCICTCDVCKPNGKDSRCNAKNITYTLVSELWRSFV